MDTQETAVNVNIEDIISLDKWKRNRPILEGILNQTIPANAYGRNERVIIYKATDGRIGTMLTIGECKTAGEIKAYLQKFDKLELKGN